MSDFITTLSSSGVLFCNFNGPLVINTITDKSDHSIFLLSHVLSSIFVDSFSKSLLFWILIFLVYRTENGQSWVLPVVREAEKILADDDTSDKSYLSTFGNAEFCKLVTEMLLGVDNPAILENRVCTPIFF